MQPYLLLVGLFAVSVTAAQPPQSSSRTTQSQHIAASPHSGVSIWFVDHLAAGTGGIPGAGRSWIAAFKDLQCALAVARVGDQVWVSAGTYIPTTPGGPQVATFRIPSGVAVYGGFDGTETDLAQRDVAGNTTILSGDINQDDVSFPSYQIVTGNSWNVVTMEGVDATTRIDGFEIRAGNRFNAPSALGSGAGLRLIDSSPTIANCRFEQCIADNGGAIDVEMGAPVVAGCTFESNMSIGSQADGGAIRTRHASLTVEDCAFAGNRAEGFGSTARGGAIYSFAGMTRIQGCSFTSNRSGPHGVAGNAVSYGGALYADSGHVLVDASIFTGNFSPVGGAVAVRSFQPAVCDLLNCTFRNNFAFQMFVSSIEAGDLAGTLYGGVNSTLNIVGCVVAGGFADNYGGALLTAQGTVSSSIFWGNHDGRGVIGVSQVKASRVYYSCVMNMLVGEPGEDPPDPQHFPGSISQNPRFVNLSIGDYRLAPTSPCIDAADNTAWPTFVSTDQVGAMRFVDDPAVTDTGIGTAPICDMGPFERQ